MNYNPYYYSNPPQYYVNVYPDIQQRNVTPYYSVHEILGPIRPEDLIQEDATCAGGKKGEKIGSKSLDLGIFGVRYEAYECQIQVIGTVLGFREQRWTLKKGQSDFEWKLEIPASASPFIVPGTHKIVGWMVGKSLWMRYEYRFGGKVRDKKGPYKIMTFPQLRFSV